MDLPFPFAGATLIVGPSQAGKTHLTARALETWIECNGLEGVVVLEFAPEVERDGRLLGGRLSRFTSIPSGVWYGILKAHAPRAEGDSDAAIHEHAATNGENAIRLLDAVPAEPTAVFINDATIPLQSGELAPQRLTDYCNRAEAAVLNAFESDKFGTEHAVSRRERSALCVLKEQTNRTVKLE